MTAGPGDNTRSGTRFSWQGTAGTSVIAVALFVLALALRLAALDVEDLSLDEALTLDLTAGRGYRHAQLPVGTLQTSMPDPTSLQGAGPAFGVFSHLGEATHPPLYFVSLRLWRDAFGESVAVSRTFSALASALAPSILFTAAASAIGTGPAICAGIAMAAAPLQVRHAVLARNYAFPLVWLLLAAAAASRIEREARGRSMDALLAFSTAGALLSHYFCVPPLAALGLHATRCSPPVRRRLLLGLGAGALAFAVTFLPLALRTLHLAGNQSGWAGEDSPTPLRIALQRLLFVPPHYLLDQRAHESALLAVGGLALFVAALLLARGGRLRMWALWAVAAPVSIAALDLLNGTRLLSLVRYTYLGAPAALVVAAAALSRVPGRAGTWLPALLPIVALLELPRAWIPISPPWSDVVRDVERRAGPADVFVFLRDPANPWETPPSVYYLLVRPHLSASYPFALVDGDMTPALLGQIRARPVWLFSQGLRLPAAFERDWQVLAIRTALEGAVIWRLIPRPSG